MTDDTGRVCMVETKTVEEATPVVSPSSILRFQVSNHLGSVGMELDGTGQLISYEEFHPYGTTAYRAANSAIEVSPSRYRYTGKERDEETGLGYHGARYYASWLGRWTAADPVGLGDGVNRFAYVHGNPARLVDSGGTTAGEPSDHVDRPAGARPPPARTAEDATLRQRGREVANRAIAAESDEAPLGTSTDDDQAIPLAPAGYPAARQRPGAFRALDMPREANALSEGLYPRPPDDAFVPTETEADMTFRQTRPGGDKLAKGTDRISFGTIDQITKNVPGAGADRPIVQLDTTKFMRGGGRYLPPRILLKHIEEVRAREAAKLNHQKATDVGRDKIRRTTSRVKGAEIARQKVTEFRESHTVGPVPPEAISLVTDPVTVARAERIGTGLSKVGKGIFGVGIVLSVGRIVTANREDLPEVVAEEVGALTVGIAGAAAGAKLGAAMGAFFGPVGAVVGGFAGGLLGGLGFGMLGADLGRTFHRDYVAD